MPKAKVAKKAPKKTEAKPKEEPVVIDQVAEKVEAKNSLEGYCFQMKNKKIFFKIYASLYCTEINTNNELLSKSINAS